MYFLSHSETINKIYQSLKSTKDIFVSSIIYGERYCGKKSLVKQIFNNSYWVDGKSIKDVKDALENNSYVVITNFEKITDLDSLNFENVNVVAIYNNKTLDSRVENKFAFIYHMPSMREREEDVKLFTQYYLETAKDIYDIKEDIKIDKNDIDISQNLKSLKKSIYKTTLLKSLNREDIFYCLYNFYLKNYNGNNIYKKELETFEKALIKSGLELYKSQLKLSEILGINRNTLRKKINEYF